MRREHHGVNRYYVTPESGDGVVRELLSSGDEPVVRIVFEFESAFRDLIGGSEQHLIFAARSRIARLGIDVIPTGPIQIEGDRAILEARVRTALRGYGLAPVLGSLIQPGLRMGRLVHCPPESQLTSDEIRDLVNRHAIQLPSDYSLDANGTLTIRTHRLRYEFSRPLHKRDLVHILTSADGKSLLNRLQIPRRVDDVEIEPGDGVITSCSMFLHEHYVVLDRGSVTLGEHLQAIVLDPVMTRGARVFLEFANSSDRKIVNPCVTAKVYRARIALPGISSAGPPQVSQGAEAGLDLDYQDVAAAFDALEGVGAQDHDLHGLVAAFPPEAPIRADATPLACWTRATGLGDEGGASLSPRSEGRTGPVHECGTSILTGLRESARATLLLGCFPDLLEHLDICQAARRGAVKRLVFRRASYDHGPFLSADDQTRLADYEALGLDVCWCNDERRHLAVHVFRGQRGFFMEPHCVERFRRSLIIAIYGSSRPLEPREEERLGELLRHLQRMFGDNLSFLTGGGPGAMQYATDCAQGLGLLAGANFIETVDQQTNKQSDYYQVFQDISRHNRHRWFEVANFQVFCVGGVGTLEEIGLTLTDIKLGVIEPAPLVFFGASEDGPFWEHLRAQLDRIVASGRGPAWLQDNVLMTSDAATVPSFYKRVLQLA